MEPLISSIRKSLADRNFYAGIFIALTLPDICGKIENPSLQSSVRYTGWFDKYLNTKYGGFMSGTECYALRCALLHEGSTDVTQQRAKEILEFFVFIDDGSHKIVFKNCMFNGMRKSFLELSAKQFCLDICTGVEMWLLDINHNTAVQERMNTYDFVQIHEAGFVHHGIRFG